MSRSVRRTPIVGITTARSDKFDKRLANRACRRAVGPALNADPAGDDVLPELRDVSNEYTMDKDGKQWIGGRWPRLMRK